MAEAKIGRDLRKLAGSYGVQTAYRDALGRRRHAGSDALFAVLRSMGAPMATPDDAPEALRVRTALAWRRPLDPVCVHWLGARPRLHIRHDDTRASSKARGRLVLEDGDERSFDFDLDDGVAVESLALNGRRHTRSRIDMPFDVPPGVHRFEMWHDGVETQTRLIAAPRGVFPPRDTARTWGVFIPTYALRSARGLGAGDLTDLRELTAWVQRLGGGAVATLPMLATFLRHRVEPSPYSPTSRLFWNELYVDPERAAEYETCNEARYYLQSPVVRDDLERLRAGGLVDYGQTAGLKRAVLEIMAAAFFSSTFNQERRSQFDAFVATRPLVREYAAFQATVERRAASWPEWPADLRSGALTPADYESSAYRYHLYAQWIAEEQMSAAAEEARRGGPGLYIDLPLGVSYDGFDVYRHRSLFALDAAVGAPPDPFFTKGQNWGFPPLIPDAVRADGYAHVRDYLHHHMRHAGIVRIDHVMALHRLFWIPKGFTAEDGLYVHYPADEWYAVLSLESHRHRTRVVGENLGTVPAYVNRALSRHNIRRMYVLQFEANPRRRPPVRATRRDSVASLNTHDMPTFASFWQAHDVDDRIDLGLLDAAAAQEERDRRQALRIAIRAELGLPPAEGAEDCAIVLEELLFRLAGDKARLLLVNLEDLWCEVEPQNTPGTLHERPNWRRKTRLPLEEIRSAPGIARVLTRINDIRRG